MEIRNWLIRALGGLTPQEADYLRSQLSDLILLREAISDLRNVVEAKISAPPSTTFSHPDQQRAKAPIRTVSVPWSIRKKQLEAEDLRRMNDEKSIRDQGSLSRS